MTCHMCDDGWSVVYGYGGVTWIQRVTLGTTGEAQRAAVWWAVEIMVSWGSSVVMCATSWGDAFKRWRDIQRQAGCVIGQAKQLMSRCVCACYGRRGAVYLHQARWVDSMWDHTNGICLIYGVESRVTGVISAVPRYTGSQLFGLLGDAAELGETYRHDQQM